MSSISTPGSQANSKTAEFARLFDVFDRVATRRARALAGEVSTANQLISADDIANVPTEFAPMLKNLSTVLTLRALRDEANTHRRVRAVSTSACVRRDSGIQTFTDMSVITPILAEHPVPNDGGDGTNLLGDGVEEEQEIETPSFPLDERYPFTFKLMLHKLYNLNEWGDKIKHVVEASKSQFKPLAECDQNVVRDATANVKEREEKRSWSRPPVKCKSASVAKPAKEEISRVLKKRCVGRRKSGPVSTGVWVYDTAVSVTEAVGPRSTVEMARSVVRGAGDNVPESHSRPRSLTPFGEIQSRDFARRKIDNPVRLVERETFVPTPPPSPVVDNSVPLVEREALVPTPPPPPVSAATPAKQIIVETKGKRAVKKRSSLASIFASASESCKMSTMKQSLCV